MCGAVLAVGVDRSPYGTCDRDRRPAQRGQEHAVQRPLGRFGARRQLPVRHQGPERGRGAGARRPPGETLAPVPAEEDHARRPGIRGHCRARQGSLEGRGAGRPGSGRDGAAAQRSGRAGKKRERRLKDAKAPGKPGEEARADLLVYDKLKAALEAGRPARSVRLADDEKPRARELFLLTAKPVLYVANVDEAQLARIDGDPLVAKVRELAEREGARAVAICSKVEAEIQQLPAGERADFLATVGLTEPGLNKLVREGFALLGLQSYFTVGEDEC